MESIVRDSLVNFMTENKLYSEYQHGFRRHRSCVTQLLEVMEDFTDMVEKGDSYDVIYLDFRKAFDQVPHLRLLKKLEAYGITGFLLKWVTSFLQDRQQWVRVGNSVSPGTGVLSGIPQGSILGPVLFTIFINDLPNCVQSYCRIFADDTKVYNSSKNSDKLQQDVYDLQKWSQKWCLFFNSSKCKVLHGVRNNPENDYYVDVDGLDVKIQECEVEKDLGVSFDGNLKFNQHIESVVNKANK